MLSRFLVLTLVTLSSFNLYAQRIVVRKADTSYIQDARPPVLRTPVLTRYGIKSSLFDLIVAGELRLQTEFTLSRFLSVHASLGTNTYQIGQLGGFFLEGYYPSELVEHGGFGWVYGLGARWYFNGEALDENGLYVDLGILNRKYFVDPDFVSNFTGTLYQFDQRVELGISLVNDNLLGDLYVFIGRRHYFGEAADFNGFGFPHDEYEYDGLTTSFGVGLRIGYTNTIYK